MKFSRRDFLKGSLALAGTSVLGILGGCSSESDAGTTPAETTPVETTAAETQPEVQTPAETTAASEEVPKEKEKSNSLRAPYDALAASQIEEKQADFVVIGAGPAGLCAAVKAAENGLKVCIIEKTSMTGGCAKFGMGILAIGTHIQQEQNDIMDLDELYNMFTEYTHYRTDCVLMRRYFEESRETLEWIEGMGVEFEEAARYFDKSYPTWHIVKSETGVVGGGMAKTMTDHLEAKARELGVEILLETTACAIETENGALTGVCAFSNDETMGYHFAGKAALIATGGFGNNEEQVKEQFGLTLKEDFFGMQFAGHEGDGLQMAWEAGVKKSEMIEEMIFDIFQPNSTGSKTADITLVMKQPNLLVNREGERFYNEEQVQNTTYMGNALCRQTGNTGFMILDEAIKQGYVDANKVDFDSKVSRCDDYSQFDENFASMEESGYTAIVKADTLEALAEKMGINPEKLKATVEEYNRLCMEGYDPLGKSPQYLKPITMAPFYAAQYFPSSYGTLGGIKINSHLEVLDVNDQVIKGLYSAGTDSCTVYGDSYMFLLPGNTMGYSVNTGRFVGEAVAEYLS